MSGPVRASDNHRRLTGSGGPSWPLPLAWPPRGSSRTPSSSRPPGLGTEVALPLSSVLTPRSGRLLRGPLLDDPRMSEAALTLPFFFFFLREHKLAGAGGGQRGGDRIRSGLCTVGTEPDAGLKLTNVRSGPELKPDPPPHPPAVLKWHLPPSGNHLPRMSSWDMDQTVPTSTKHRTPTCSTCSINVCWWGDREEGKEGSLALSQISVWVPTQPSDRWRRKPGGESRAGDQPGRASRPLSQAEPPGTRPGPRTQGCEHWWACTPDGWRRAPGGKDKLDTGESLLVPRHIRPPCAARGFPSQSQNSRILASKVYGPDSGDEKHD